MRDSLTPPPPLGEPAVPGRRQQSGLEVYSRLREMILDFDLYPGTRMTEQELADDFHVSRTPVREALRRLESEGLVIILPKQGCYVRNVDIETISALYDVRVALEGMAVELACEQMSQSELEQLASDWDPASMPSVDQYVEHISVIEESFHTRLAEGSGNAPLAAYLKDVNDHIRIIRRLGFPDEISIRETYEEHHEICRLLLIRDCAGARESMVRHIRKSQSIARKVTLSQLEQHRKRQRDD